MATYSYDNFIKTPVEGDKKLFIYDASGNLRYTLEPLDVNFFYRNNKVIVHHLRTRIEKQPCRDHSYAELDFDTQATAELAELKANDAKNLILAYNDYYTETEVDAIVVDLESQIHAVATGSTFIGLTDTPTDYVTGRTLTVNSAGTGVEFTNNEYVNTFSNSSETLIRVGGVEAGSIFESASMQDMWDNLLYPDLTPRFTSFSIANISNLEVGDTTYSGVTTFSWALQYPTLFEEDTLRIYDRGLNYITYNTGLTSPQDHYLTGITQTTKTYWYWIIRARKTGTPTYPGRSYKINWFWNTWYGTSSSIITGVTSYSEINSFDSVLTELISGEDDDSTYDFSGTGYKYFFIPTTSGYHDYRGRLITKVPDSFTDQITRLGVAMAGPSDGYDDGSSGGYYYKNVTIENQFGISSTYRMYRTKYQLGGDISIIIS